MDSVLEPMLMCWRVLQPNFADKRVAGIEAGGGWWGWEHEWTEQMDQRRMKGSSKWWNQLSVALIRHVMMSARCTTDESQFGTELFPGLISDTHILCAKCHGQSFSNLLKTFASNAPAESHITFT